MRTRQDIEKLEDKILASYAMKSMQTSGRQYLEPDHETRTCYQRDRDRIIHCEAFRKLEYKTQVFIIFEGDYYRTRLTHTLEVAQIARTIGRNLLLNEDLIEAIALAHDLGHPPFGHAGEEALDEIMKKANLHGFNHNKRSFEIVTKFEKRYPYFNGLNLSREVLIGILKHKTTYDIPITTSKEFSERPTLEAQVVDVADSLAYLNHDIDDGLTSGYITAQDLMGSTLWQKAYRDIQHIAKSEDKEIFKNQIVRSLIDRQVKDLLEVSSKRLKEEKFKNVQEVKKCKKVIIGFSREMASQRDDLQQMVNKKLYHHYRVERMTSKAKRFIRNLFEAYEKNPRQLPSIIYNPQKKYNLENKYDIICNYIASMTDRFALDEHKKLFDPYEKV